MADNDPLEAFFGGRKIGWTGIVQGRWQWRGSGYDEGWEDATDDELRELHRLLGDHLEATTQPDCRILWNVRGEDIDEIVVTNATVHIEQMNDRCWWIGIDLPGGGYWAGNFTCDSRGRMRFWEQESDGFEWGRDDAHREADDA